MRSIALFAALSAFLFLETVQAQDGGAPPADVPDAATRPAGDFVALLLDWMRSAYDREPQLVTASVVMVLGLTALSMVALTFTAGRRGLAALRQRGSAGTREKAKPAAPILHNAPPKRTIPALEIVDDGATALPVRGRMIRIGRHEENDICLSSKSVHRYHAVMHLTEEQSYIITDISGLDGNGVFVNAERIDNVMLQNGDLIELGDVKLRFRLNELH